MDSQTTKGAIRSIHNMILENQGFHYGYKHEDDELEVKKRFREMYYPSSIEWKVKIMDQSREMLDVVIKRYQDLEIIGKTDGDLIP